MKTIKTLALFLVTLALPFSYLFTYQADAAATFNPNYIISDGVFNDSTSMSAAQIDAFLNTFPSSCISTHNGFTAPQPTGYSPSTSFTYGSDVSAGTVIYDSAQAYGINPEVLLTTMEKEQSLVTGDTGCSVLQYVGAMGYGCPDGGTTYAYSGSELYSISGVPVTSVSGTCVDDSGAVGFSKQVIVAAWRLEFNMQRSEGNVNWSENHGSWDDSDDPGYCYNGGGGGGIGYMTAGSWALAATPTCSNMSCPSACNQAYTFDGNYTIDSTVVQMETGATASLYNYTPHISGNTNFFNIFNGWFGNPTTPCYGTSNLSGVTSGQQIVSYKYSASAPSDLAYLIMNNTGSTCVEAHIFNPGYQSWQAHIATAMAATNPTQGALIPMSLPYITGTTADTLAYVKYSGTNGDVEIHLFSPGLQTFPGYYDVATDLSGVSPSTGTFVAGDFLGTGYDQLAYILFDGSTGHLEVHLFNPSLTKAIGYYDVATNLTGVTASTGTFVAGDFFGLGYDQLAYVLYNGSTNRLELHVFNRSLTSSTLYQVPTDLSGVNASTGTFVAGNFLGTSYDQLDYILYDGSTGMVESHLFTPNLEQAIGYQDIATALPAINPSD